MSPEQIETQDTALATSVATATATATGNSGTAASGSQHVYGVPIGKAKEYLNIKASRYRPEEIYDIAMVGTVPVLLDDYQRATMSLSKEEFERMEEGLESFVLPGSNPSLAPPMGVDRLVRECSEAFTKTSENPSAGKAFGGWVKNQICNEKNDLKSYITDHYETRFRELDGQNSSKRG